MDRCNTRDRSHRADANRSFMPSHKVWTSIHRWFSSIHRRKKQEESTENQIIPSDPYSPRKEMININQIPFMIPRHISEVREGTSASFERARLSILRMDESLVSSDQSSSKRQHHNLDSSVGIHALAEGALSLHRLAFREMLSVDETLPMIETHLNEENFTMNEFFRQAEKIDPVTTFHQAHDLKTFEEVLNEHRQIMMNKPISKPSEMNYLKFCLLLEIRRDEDESCLRIFLHDIIFKYHLADFRLRCEIHLRKPIENQLVIDKQIHDSHVDDHYAAEFTLWSGDWIVQQEVECYIVMKIESLAMNKYIAAKFFDMAHLHVRNVPHGASRIFLREMTAVARPLKLLSREIHVGQVEIEAMYRSDERKLLIRIVKVSHSQIERLLRAPETYVEIIFQNTFNIYEVKRTRIAERSSNPIFDEEFVFDIPKTVAMGDITVDLLFFERSSLHHHPIVLGVLTLSKHTDWFPVRKFWIDLEENPNVRLKDRFLFEGNLYE